MIPVTVLPRLLIELLLLAIYFSVRRLKRLPALNVFAAVICLLLARDLLYALSGEAVVLPLSNLAVVSAYLLWLRLYTGRRAIDAAYVLVNVAVAAVAVVNIFHGFLPLSEFAIGLVILADTFYLALFLSLVSEYNTENAGIILRTRFYLAAGLVLLNLITLLYGYENAIIQNLALPLSHFLHAYVLFQYTRLFSEETERSAASLAGNLESLFEFMGNLGNAIAEKIDIPRALEIIVSSAARNIGADAGAILMVDEYEDILQVKATYGIYPPLEPVSDIVKLSPGSVLEHFKNTPVPIGNTLLGSVVESAEPLLIRNTFGDRRLSANSAEDILYISSFIAIPLIVGNRVLGVLSTLKRAENQVFSDREFEHLKTFADYASITLDSLLTYLEVLEKREMDREVWIAADIQQKLLPGKMPEMKNAALSLFSLPARGVSGDYYDVFRLDGDKIALIIGDVAGKGVPAALVMVMIRSILHLIVSAQREAAAILSWVNRGITGRIDIDHFATLSYLVFDQEKREIVYANAAHHPLLVYKSRPGKLVEVDTPGLPIGIERSTVYRQKRFAVEAGDLLLLYTDGVVEAMNPAGEQYTLGRLRRVVEENSVLPADELIELIKGDLREFVGAARQHDDQTLLLMKFQ
jgi:sigma-B regulation protein RsbU (phosphoserine phosphatase)